MRPFRERNPLPIGIIGIVTILVIVLLAFNANALPFIGGGDTYHADFADAGGLKVGDDVRHGKWGEGIILLLEGTGDKAEAVVRFPDVGEKRLLLSWAPLTKL